MIRFTKMHGIGNDYVYVNCFEERVDDPVALAPKIADRHFGVGGDGLILVLPPEQGVDAHVSMRMFNADGSESEMCGNGIRCVCKLAHDRGICTANPMKVQTGAGVLELKYTLDAKGKVEMVTVDMGEPILDAAQIPVDLPIGWPGDRVVDVPCEQLLPSWDEGMKSHFELDGRMTCISMGNPHLVLFCEWTRAVPLEVLGPVFEVASIFPNRTNVHFVEVRSRGEINMRTWERGSGITLACGTGAAAVCAAGALTGRTNRKILAHLPGGDLKLRWDEKTNHVLKTGPAVEVFTGEWRG